MTPPGNLTMDLLHIILPVHRLTFTTSTSMSITLASHQSSCSPWARHLWVNRPPIDVSALRYECRHWHRQFLSGHNFWLDLTRCLRLDSTHRFCLDLTHRFWFDSTHLPPIWFDSQRTYLFSMPFTSFYTCQPTWEKMTPPREPHHGPVTYNSACT